MGNREQEPEERRPLLTGIRRVAVLLTLPLVAAALLWWLPGSLSETRWVSLVVIVVALAGWWYWRDEE